VNELQKKVDELIKEFGGYWEPFEMLAAVVEELGEFSREMLRYENVKEKGNKEKLEEEFGDLLFTLACIANYYDLDMYSTLNKSISKYSNRDKTRWI